MLITKVIESCAFCGAVPTPAHTSPPQEEFIILACHCSHSKTITFVTRDGWNRWQKIFQAYRRFDYENGYVDGRSFLHLDKLSEEYILNPKKLHGIAFD